MELKRYVLDTQRCFIYDLTKEADVKKFEMISKFSTHFVNGACKTSDNILDLVEKGDLVELDGKSKRNDVHMIVSVIDGDMITYDDLFIYKNKNYDDVTAIYKKQPNGDYKRYPNERT